MASLTSARKLTASFSNRVASRRLSFSQPTHRSTTFRRRYASRSNFTRPSSGRWSLRRGMTAPIPRRRRYARMRRWLYPLSPASRRGRFLGLPRPGRGSRTASSTGSRCLLSCACPADRRAASGRPLPSVTRCSLVENPPRLRPRAWSAGSPGAFFPPGRRPAGPDARGVHAPQVDVDQPPLVELQVQPLQDAVERAVPPPAGEPVVDRLPVAVALGQLAPLGAGVQHPQDAVEGGPVVVPLAAPPADGRQQVLDQC